MDGAATLLAKPSPDKSSLGGTAVLARLPTDDGRMGVALLVLPSRPSLDGLLGAALAAPENIEPVFGRVLPVGNVAAGNDGTTPPPMTPAASG